MKKIISPLFSLILMGGLYAQDSASAVKSLLDSKRYSFIPQTMSPARGTMRPLTGGFSLDVKGDSLAVYLPYTGRAYSAPIDPSDAGYNFTSTNYDYAIKKGKKNRYEISMKIKDRFSGTEFYLTVFDNKSASLQASSNDKQSISYNGYIQQLE
ncbi:DUF4251 domain-containing protein [Parafilimonas sp.]|uniref:DUF4251 domain-containing protein n=1 Tax=Parafilimonas sp. TaxID=1969739 RepID=UPI0039E32607